MRLTDVILDDFGPFGPETLWKLPEVENLTLLVRGTVSGTQSDKRSNGAGKSRLFEAIYWCLTGDTVRNIPKEELVRLGQSEAYVETIWEMDGSTGFDPGYYSIIRTWSRTKKSFRIMRYDEDQEDWQDLQVFHSADQGTQWFMEILGLSKELIALVCFFGRRFTTYSRMDKNQRANVIDLIAGARCWEEAAGVARKNMSASNNKQSEVQRTLERLNKKLDELILEKEDLEQEVDELQQKHGDPEKLQTSLDTAEKERQRLSQQLDKLNDAIDSLADRMESTDELIHEAELVITDRNNTIKGVTNEIQKINDSLEAGECPTCGKPLTDKKTTSKLKKQRTELQEKELKQAEDGLDALKDDLNQLKELKEKLRKRKEDQREKVLTTGQEKQLLENEINSTTKKLNELKSNEELMAAQQQLKVLVDKTIPATEKELQDEQEHMDELLHLYEMDKFWAAGMRQIHYQVMESTAQVLAGFINTYSQQFGLEADNVVLTVWKKASGSKSVKPEVDLFIVRNLERLSIDSLSDGETQRLDLACFFAIGSVVNTLMRLNLNWRVFDEPLTGLDADGRYQVFNAIKNMPGVSQRFVMDHDANFNDLFEHSITVAKNNGISTITGP